MERDNPQVDIVHVVGPVDHQAAPNHDPEHRGVDPVHPTNCFRVFWLQTVHKCSPPCGPGRPKSRSGLRRVYILSFLTPSILSPPILSPPILSPPILSAPILSALIFSPLILSPPLF